MVHPCKLSDLSVMELDSCAQNECERSCMEFMALMTELPDITVIIKPGHCIKEYQLHICRTKQQAHLESDDLEYSIQASE